MRRAVRRPAFSRISSCRMMLLAPAPTSWMVNHGSQVAAREMQTGWAHAKPMSLAMFPAKTNRVMRSLEFEIRWEKGRRGTGRGAGSRAGTVKSKKGGRDLRKIAGLARGTDSHLSRLWTSLGPSRGANDVSGCAHVAGTGLDANRGAAAVDLSGDVVAIERSLHRHFMIGVDRA